MRSTMQNLTLAAVTILVIAFVVSFALGVRPQTVPSAAVDAPRIVPGVFSGKRVEVLNASGKSGLARNVTEMLRAAGYDVVYFGNAARSAERASIVLDRVGKPEIARAVAARLQIARTETRLDVTRLVEVSVVLGPDWTAPDSTNAGRGRR